jgi:hypothetical protein
MYGRVMRHDALKPDYPSRETEGIEWMCHIVEHDGLNGLTCGNLI